MFKNFTKDIFTEMEHNEVEGRVYDHHRKICYVIRTIDSTILEKEIYKKDLKPVTYKDYNIIGILFLNNIDSLVDVEIFFDKVLVLISQNENHPQLFKNIVETAHILFNKDTTMPSCPSMVATFNELNIIKNNNLEMINHLDKILSLRFRTLILSHKEPLYRDILFTDKPDKKKLLLKYIEHKDDIINIKDTISRAKEYFKYKETS